MGPAHAQLTCADAAARVGKRYPSDLADREWAVITPLLPVPRPVAAGGRWCTRGG